MIDYTIKQYKSDNPGDDRSYEDIISNKKLLAHFKKAVTFAKTELAGHGINNSEMNIDAVSEDGWQHSLSRAKFENTVFNHREVINGEQQNQTFTDKMLAPIHRAFAKTNDIRREDITEVVLVGGSTRIPKVQNIIREFFGE